MEEIWCSKSSFSNFYISTKILIFNNTILNKIVSFYAFFYIKYQIFINNYLNFFNFSNCTRIIEQRFFFN